ncbi:MAG TPA: rod shape-determining protein MreD [Acidimicrobiales bacterium]
MSPGIVARLRLTALLLLTLLIQVTVASDVRVRGVAPDLLLLFTICAGLAGGSALGMTFGFAAGLLADLFLHTTPLGLSALTYCLIGFAVGALRRGVLREGRLLAPIVALVASAAGVVLFVLIGAMVGQSQLSDLGPRRIIETAVVVGVMNAVLAFAAAPIVAWAAGGSAVGTRTDNSALLK